jgi:hypothetical protein
MAVVQALQEAGVALRRNPLIAGVVLVLVAIQLPTQFAQVADPIVATGISAVFSLVMVVVAPFLFGGLLGMADEALDGTTGFDTFIAAGKQYYTSMLGAYLLMLGGMVVLWIVGSVVSIALIAVIGAASGGVSGTASPAFIAMFLVGVGVSLLVLFLPLFFVQFYGQAIVLDDKSAIGGFKRSVGLVRRNLIPVFVYSLLVFVGGMFFGLLGSIPSMMLSRSTTQVLLTVPLPDLSLPVVVALTVVGNVLLGVLGSLFLVFSVAFYRTLNTAEDTGDSPSTRGTVA